MLAAVLCNFIVNQCNLVFGDPFRKVNLSILIRHDKHKVGK